MTMIARGAFMLACMANCIDVNLAASPLATPCATGCVFCARDAGRPNMQCRLRVVAYGTYSDLSPENLSTR